eukprot:150130-Pyramimonas_sp.AAC.1
MSSSSDGVDDARAPSARGAQQCRERSDIARHLASLQRAASESSSGPEGRGHRARTHGIDWKHTLPAKSEPICISRKKMFRGRIWHRE